jgi:hypothetical protein
MDDALIPMDPMTVIDDDEEADEEDLHIVTIAMLMVTAAEAAQLFQNEQHQPT